MMTRASDQKSTQHNECVSDCLELDDNCEKGSEVSGEMKGREQRLPKDRRSSQLTCPQGSVLDTPLMRYLELLYLIGLCVIKTAS